MAALLRLLLCIPVKWFVPHLAVGARFDCCEWTCRVTQSVQRTPLGPASWLPAIEKVRVPSRLSSRGFGRPMMIGFSTWLRLMLCK